MHKLAQHPETVYAYTCLKCSTITTFHAGDGGQFDCDCSGSDEDVSLMILYPSGTRHVYPTLRVFHEEHGVTA